MPTSGYVWSCPKKILVTDQKSIGHDYKLHPDDTMDVVVRGVSIRVANGATRDGVGVWLTRTHTREVEQVTYPAGMGIGAYRCRCGRGSMTCAASTAAARPPTAPGGWG